MSTATINRSVREARTTCAARLHDTASAYTSNGCRCPKARAAHSADSRQLRAVRAARRHTRGKTQAEVEPAQPSPSMHFSNDSDRGCAPGKADPDAFFPTGPDGERDIHAERRTIAAHCVPCPVNTACRAWAITTGQNHGVWGGMTTRQLRLAVAHYQQHAPAEPEPVIEVPAPAPRPSYDYAILDPQVAALHAKGKSDVDIALSAGVSRRAVTESRRRQNLPALFGPAGRPTAAYHQLVKA
jgi:WhiB family redox-sensing transcriptional regulator